jgi:broad specificity phosphatase PhoE
MTRRLYWVRHGPTHQKTFTGWRDVPADLSDVDAIARLDAFLPDRAPVVSSDLVRAITTADALQGTRPRLAHQPALREFDFGHWDGLHHSEVAMRDPHLSRLFWEKPGDVAAPGGESWNAVAGRVAPAIDTLWTASHDDLIAVAHFGVILCHLSAATGLTPYKALGHKIDNLSVTVLVQEGAHWVAERINHTP